MSNSNDDIPSAPGYGAPPVQQSSPKGAPMKQADGASPFRAVPTTQDRPGLKIAVGLVTVLVIGLLIAGWLRASVERQRNEALEIARQAQRSIEQQRASEPETIAQPTPVQAPVVAPVVAPTPAAVAAVVIESTMRARVEQVGRRCFDIVSGSDPSASGRVSMRVSVNPVTGVVDIQQLDHGSLPTSFIGCFRSDVERPAIAIPPGASAGAPVEVRFNLDYGR